MTRAVAVHLPVADLRRSVDFFTRLGFALDLGRSEDDAACMIVNEYASVVLTAEPLFAARTDKEVVDATAATEAVIAIWVPGRDAVDGLIAAAVAAGGQELDGPRRRGPRYSRSFDDLDGHQWEIVHTEQDEAGPAVT